MSIERSPSDISEPAEEKGISRRGFLKGMIAAGALAISGESLAAHNATEAESNLEKDARDWEAYKKIARDPAVREHIAFLRKTYGEAGRSFTAKALDDLAFVDQLMETEAAGKQLNANENGKALLASALTDFRLLWDRSAFDARVKAEENEGLHAEFVGFDRLPGYSNAAVRKLVEDRFPRRWAYGNISRFRYVDEESREPAFKVAGRAFAEGLSGMLYKSGREEVVIYKHEGKLSEWDMIELLGHEIAHHEDWQHNNRLPIQERFAFLREVTERMSAPDRFSSDYVLTDTPANFKHLPPEEIAYRQAVEYWATIAEEYDGWGEDFKKEYPVDFDLVLRWRSRLIEDPA